MPGGIELQARQKLNPEFHSSDDSDIVDLGALLRTIWRGKWLVAIVTILIILAGGYYAFVGATPLYRSTSVVILETQEQQIVDLESVVGGLSGDTAEVNSEVEILRSRSLMEKVVSRLDLTVDPEFNQLLQPPGGLDVLLGLAEARLGVQLIDRTDPATLPQQRVLDGTVDALLERVVVRNVPQSFVFQITVETQSADKSALIADTIAEMYIVNQLDVKFEATQQATEWLTGRVTELQVELEKAEAAVSQFNAGTDLVSVEALQALERQLKDLRERRDAAAENVQAAQARAQVLTANPDASRADKAELADDTQLTRFLSRIGNDTQGAMAQAFDTRFSQLIARADLDLSRAEAQLAALSQSITEIDGQIASQNRDLITLQQLSREAEASRLLYEYFLGRLKETSAQQGIQQADSRILSDAVVPLQPASPRKPLILVVSAILGVIVGTGMVLVLEYRQNTYRTARDLEVNTGYTVMGQIPLIPARRRRDALKYLAEKPTSAAAEAVRNLRTSVLLSNVDKPPQVIMSTSSIPGEGKTTVSLSLAQNLVGMGRKVLLIEGDIRRRVFGQYLDTDQKDGLLSVLSGARAATDVVLHDDRVGADILIGEPSDTNAADIFSSDRFGAFLAEMRNAYDVVIIDTPPVLVVPDARIIAQSCDTILFTVKWDATSRPQVEESLRLFESVGQKVNGIVLNQISPRGMKRYGYGGKYGAYSAYGKKYYVN